MGVQVAEPRGEVAMLDRRDVLVLEEDHLVVQQRLPDRADQVVGLRRREVDALDHRADGGRERLDLERHGRPPRCAGRAKPIGAGPSKPNQTLNSLAAFTASHCRAFSAAMPAKSPRVASAGGERVLIAPETLAWGCRRKDAPADSTK